MMNAMMEQILSVEFSLAKIWNVTRSLQNVKKLEKVRVHFVNAILVIIGQER